MKGLSLGPRAQAVLALALVAAVGALLGILGDRLLAGRRVAPTEIVAPPPPRGGPGPGQRGLTRFGDQLAERLELSATQRAAIDSILAEEQQRVRSLSREFQPQFRAIAVQTRQRVEAVLTPEQREEMRTLRSERMRRLGEDRPQFRDAVRPR